MYNELIPHKIEDINFYVNEDMNIIDHDGYFVYCQFHHDQRLFMNHKGFIVCNTCNKILRIEDFK